MAQMEKIKFLSKVKMSSAPIDSGCIRNIWSGTDNPEGGPATDITDWDPYYKDSRWYHDVYIGTYRLSMGAGFDDYVACWGASGSEIGIGRKLRVQCDLYFEEWYRSFLFTAGTTDADGYFLSAIRCDEETIKNYVKQLDNDSNGIPTYEVTIPYGCSYIYIQVMRESVFNVTRLPASLEFTVTDTAKYYSNGYCTEGNYEQGEPLDIYDPNNRTGFTTYKCKLPKNISQVTIVSNHFYNTTGIGTATSFIIPFTKNNTIACSYTDLTCFPYYTSNDYAGTITVRWPETSQVDYILINTDNDTEAPTVSYVLDKDGDIYIQYEE